MTTPSIRQTRGFSREARDLLNWIRANRIEGFDACPSTGRNGTVSIVATLPASGDNVRRVARRTFLELDEGGAIVWSHDASKRDVARHKNELIWAA